ncbi:hypothetical protein [Kerstersia similis]|uniref:hypothetical protein n=1 Tax=Kerstersia similis TaxID=206505 RepID=UPI0039F111CA
MFYTFLLFLILTVLPLLCMSLPAFLRQLRGTDARVRLWWGLCLAGTALWGLALVVFSDSCLSFGGGQNVCQSQLNLPDWFRMAALAYVPLGGVAVPVLWFMVFYVAVRRAQQRRIHAGEDS